MYLADKSFWLYFSTDIEGYFDDLQDAANQICDSFLRPEKFISNKSEVDVSRKPPYVVVEWNASQCYFTPSGAHIAGVASLKVSLMYEAKSDAEAKTISEECIIDISEWAWNDEADVPEVEFELVTDLTDKPKYSKFVDGKLSSFS